MKQFMVFRVSFATNCPRDDLCEFRFRTVYHMDLDTSRLVRTLKKTTKRLSL